MDTRVKPAYDEGPGGERKPSIILQQPLDVIEFDLRAGRIGEAATQFFQDAAHPLHVDLAGDFHRIIVGEFVGPHRPQQWILAVGAGLLTTLGVAGAVARLVAIAGLHVGKALGTLAQSLQRLALRIHRAVGVAFAEPAARIAHGGIGLLEPVLAVTLVGALLGALLTLFAPLAFFA